MSMNRKARRAAKSAPNAAKPPSRLRALLDVAATCLNRGDPRAAESAARQALAVEPDAAEGHYLLGNAVLMQGRPAEAAAAYRRAIEIAPEYPEPHNNLGLILERQGRIEEAARLYTKAVALRPTYAVAHNNLGNALAGLGRGDEATDSFRAAITLKPNYPEAWYNFANVLANIGREEDAVDAYRQALAFRPQFPEALNNLSALLVKSARPAEAEAAGRAAIATAPQAAEGYYNLGDALRDGGKPQEAIAAYRQAITLRPGDVDSHIAIGNILQGLGRTEEALELFRQAQRLRPLTRWRAAKAKPDFSVLLLTAPGAANTPAGYLVGRGAYDSWFLGLIPGTEYEAGPLLDKADVIVNLISDIDRTGGLLPLAADLIVRLGRPVINPPDKILATGRDAMPERLAGIPHCRVPRTIRLKAGAEPAAAPPDFPLPALIRPGGAHGGDDFEKIENFDAISPFTARHPGADHYLTEFVDFRSPDGNYRKYRLIFIDGHILPYHLAIADQWKVHYFRTDMANQPWMRAEEEAFLQNPETVFGPAGMEALSEIAARIGLDYCGIDCALHQDGSVLVFEANATMLVHGETTVFAYKQPYIARIKAAFDAMLERAALKASG